MWPATRPNPFKQAEFTVNARMAAVALYEIVSDYNTLTKYSFPPHRHQAWPLQLPHRIRNFMEAELVYNAIMELAGEMQYFAELYDTPTYIEKSSLLIQAAAQFALAKTEAACVLIGQAATE
jgi:hypothetical protein